jgi:hypothetical protein
MRPVFYQKIKGEVMYLKNYKLVKRNDRYIKKRPYWGNRYYRYYRKKPFDCVEIDVDDYNTITYRIVELFDVLSYNEVLGKLWGIDTPITDDVVTMLEYIKNELEGCIPDDVAEFIYERIKAEEYYERDCD